MYTSTRVKFEIVSITAAEKMIPLITGIGTDDETITSFFIKRDTLLFLRRPC